MTVRAPAIDPQTIAALIGRALCMIPPNPTAFPDRPRSRLPLLVAPAVKRFNGGPHRGPIGAAGPRPRAGCRRSDYRRRCFLPQTRHNNMDSAGRVESGLAYEGMGAGRRTAYHCKVFAQNDPHDVEVAMKYVLLGNLSPEYASKQSERVKKAKAKLDKLGIFAASPKCGLLNQSHTRSISASVLRFRSSQARLRHNDANFGIGTLERA